MEMLPESYDGRAFECDFGMFTPRMTFGPNGLHLRATLGDIEIDETVEVSVKAIRPRLYALHWVESSGTFVVHTHDHETMHVHSFARLPDGQILVVEGKMRQVA